MLSFQVKKAVGYLGVPIENTILREGIKLYMEYMKCGDQVKSIGGTTGATERKTASGTSKAAHTSAHTTLYQLRDISTRPLHKRLEPHSQQSTCH